MPAKPNFGLLGQKQDNTNEVCNYPIMTAFTYFC